MLTPKQLLEIADSMQPHLDELNTWITKDIIRRVMARLNRTNELKLSATDVWQTQVLRDAGGHTEELQKQLSRFTQNSEDEIRAIFEDAGLLSYAADAQVFQAAGIRATPLRQSPRMIEILTDAYRRTNAEIRNFTRTTAIQSTSKLIRVLDAAHFKTMSGAQSYSAAVAEAVEELANYQARVSYPTGHTDTLETAVFRAVRTGVAQACGNMSVASMEAHEWDIVLVSAHLGARYGDGGENPGNHFWWQGRFYSLNGKTPGLPPFRESTGYGTGEGLCGWNCRHSFGPGDGKHNPYQQFDAEENKAAYDLSQKQRSMEAAIRRNKHRLIAYQEAAKGAESDADKAKARQRYDATLATLKRQNAAYDQFCSSNNLKRQAERLQVAKLRQAMAEKKQDIPDPAANTTVQAANAGASSAIRNTGAQVYFNPEANYSVKLNGYSDKINAGLSRAILEVAQKGSASRTEHMYLVNLKTGTLDFYETNGEFSSVGYAFRRYLEEHPSDRFAFVHNHNTDGSFSETDLQTLLTHPQIPVMVAARNDGVVYVAERAGGTLKSAFFDDLYPNEMESLNKRLRDGLITMSQRTRLREEFLVQNILRDYTKGKGLIEYDG